MCIFCQTRSLLCHVACLYGAQFIHSELLFNRHYHRYLLKLWSVADDFLYLPTSVPYSVFFWITHLAFCFGSTHTHTHLTALFSRTIWVSWHQKDKKVKPIWILLKQEKVSGSGISWAICKSAPRCRQITTPAPHHSVIYRPDALPAAQPTVSKHQRLALGPHAWIKLYTEGIHAEWTRIDLLNLCMLWHRV